MSIKRIISFVDGGEYTFCEALIEQARTEGADAVRLLGEVSEPMKNQITACGISLSHSAEIVGCWALNGPELDNVLSEFYTDTNVNITAPATNHYYRNRPVFPISPAKAGTHLLMDLLEGFGYARGHEAPLRPEPGMWHYLEYTNAHTGARDFFVDSVRKNVHGNRLHPFARNPCVLLYRHPYDILLSEANYYHKDGNTLFSGYLSKLSFEERLLRLVDDPWMLGTLRDRVGQFIPWMDFPNVISVSFEELVGPKGGGSLEMQENAIWSLQLKLHVPGNPSTFASSIFNPESPTFNAGKIGRHLDGFSDAVQLALGRLSDDFVTGFGYKQNNRFSDKIEKYIKTKPEYSVIDFSDVDILHKRNFLGYNIIGFQGGFIGVPLNKNDITQQDIIYGNNVETVIFLIYQKLLPS